MGVRYGGRPRIYRGPTAPFAFRISNECRTLLEFVSARAGVSPGMYVRQVLEQHLFAEGFEPRIGFEVQSDPDWGTPEGWVRDRTIDDDEAA